MNLKPSLLLALALLGASATTQAQITYGGTLSTPRNCLQQLPFRPWTAMPWP